MNSPAKNNLDLLIKTFDAISARIESEADEDTKKEIQKDLDNLRLLISKNQKQIDEFDGRKARIVQRAKDKLREEEEKWKRIESASLSSASDGVVVVGGRRTKITMTEAFREMRRKEIAKKE